MELRQRHHQPTLARRVTAEKSFNEINLKSLSETNLDKARVVKQTWTAEAKEQRGNLKSSLRVVGKV